MAGHRRGTGRPKQARARIERRRAALADKLAAAHTPAAQVGACADYLRSALKRADPERATAVAEEACAQLCGLADRLAVETWKGTQK